MERVVRMDPRGRITIPAEFRRRLGLVGGGLLHLKLEGDVIVMRVRERVAERLYGVYRVENWPGDIDRYLVEESWKWLE